MKKISAILLSLSLLVSVFTFCVGAEGTSAWVKAADTVAVMPASVPAAGYSVATLNGLDISLSGFNYIHLTFTFADDLAVDYNSGTYFYLRMSDNANVVSQVCFAVAENLVKNTPYTVVLPFSGFTAFNGSDTLIKDWTGNLKELIFTFVDNGKAGLPEITVTDIYLSANADDPQPAKPAQPVTTGWVQNENTVCVLPATEAGAVDYSYTVSDAGLNASLIGFNYINMTFTPAEDVAVGWGGQNGNVYFYLRLTDDANVVTQNAFLNVETLKKGTPYKVAFPFSAFTAFNGPDTLIKDWTGNLQQLILTFVDAGKAGLPEITVSDIYFSVGKNDPAPLRSYAKKTVADGGYYTADDKTVSYDAANYGDLAFTTKFDLTAMADKKEDITDIGIYVYEAGVEKPTMQSAVIDPAKLTEDGNTGYYRIIVEKIEETNFGRGVTVIPYILYKDNTVACGEAVTGSVSEFSANWLGVYTVSN